MHLYSAGEYTLTILLLPTDGNKEQINAYYGLRLLAGARTRYFNLHFLCSTKLLPAVHLRRVTCWKGPRLNLRPRVQHHSYVPAHLKPARQQAFSWEAVEQDCTEIYSVSQVQLLGEHWCLASFVPCVCMCEGVCACFWLKVCLAASPSVR